MDLSSDLIEAQAHYTKQATVKPQQVQNTKANLTVQEKKYENGMHYKGMFMNNKRHGKGKLTWPNGETYDGDFVDDLRNG
jgi:hypothetical protein